MVAHTRGATRRAYSFQAPALDPSCDRGRPATTFSVDTLVTSVSLELSPLRQIPVRQPGSRLGYHVVSACKQTRHTHTLVLPSERGAAVSYDTCPHRLIYTSRFVRVIYSSCIVLIRPGTVTPLRRRGLRVHVR